MATGNVRRETKYIAQLFTRVLYKVSMWLKLEARIVYGVIESVNGKICQCLNNLIVWHNQRHFYVVNSTILLLYM